MKQTRQALETRLDALAASIPQLMSETDEPSQMDAFAGVADEILEAAAVEDRDHVWSRLQCILREAGLIPGDDEPCDDGGT